MSCMFSHFHVTLTGKEATIQIGSKNNLVSSFNVICLNARMSGVSNRQDIPTSSEAKSQ